MTGPVTLPDLLRRGAADAPERVALGVAGGRCITLREWEERSTAVSGGLQRAGVGVGDRVALQGDLARWSEYAVSYLAVHKAGAVAVPLPEGLNDIEIGRIVGDLRPAAIVAAPGLARRRVPAPSLDPTELEGRGGDSPPGPPARPPDLGEILCASHPLSGPVYVSRSHRALLGGPSLSPQAAGGSPSLLHAFPVGTLAGQDALCAALRSASRRSVALPDVDPDRLGALLARGGIGTCAVHPAVARALLDTGAIARHDLSGVRGLVLAGGRVRPALLVALTAAFPRAALLLVDVLGGPPGPRTVFAHDRSRPGAVGRPAEGTDVAVTDPAGRPVADGRVGRLRVRTTAAEQGRQGPGDGDGRVPTGDLGLVDDAGALYVVGAGNDVVRGRRTTVVKPEIEEVLRGHPAVADAAVLGVPRDGSGGRLTTAVALASAVPAPELEDLVRGRLGEDKVPEEIVFVDEIPRSSSGAVRQAQLRRRLGLAVGGGGQAEGPTPAQETVAAVWRRVLGREDIGPEDDFFVLGGHGSSAATMLGLLEDALEVSLPLSAFLEDPTLDGLARALQGLSSGEGGDPPAAPVGFSQEGMLWHELFAPGCQNLPGLARRFRGPLDVAALGRSLDEITRRHEALRTTFELRGRRLVQVVHPHRPPVLSVRDLTGLAPGEREGHVEGLVAEAGRTPFDLVAGPLFASTLLRLADDDHVLVIRTHHSVFDDWSVGVFRRELAALYTAYAGGQDSPLPELPVAFSELCRRQRRRLAGRPGTRELGYWRRELADAPLANQLPVHDPGRPEGAPQATGRPVSLTLPSDVSDRLRALARRERVTVFMALLAAFGVLVRRWTEQDDLLLATVVANRNATEMEAPIGCFTKKVPLCLRLGGDPTITEALGRARAALLGSLSHQDLPFETVIQDVLGAPAAAHGLVPHVAVMFQGVTPAQELVLPGVESSGFETSTTAARAHFMARDAEEPDDDVPWGAGLYRGTFVILSVADSGGELSCIARGAFHAPAVRALMDGFAGLLGEVAADPARRLSELAVAGPPPEAEATRRELSGSTDDRVDLRGFRVDLAVLRSALAGCPGVREVAVRVVRDEHGEPALVASVVPDGRPPTLAELRAFLWAKLPGYAWPSALLVVDSLSAGHDAETAPGAGDGVGAPAGQGTPTIEAEESLLGTLWGEVLGVEQAAPGENYSQAFSFAQALARARDAGVSVPGEHVTRNRTVRTLAAALAAHRHPPKTS